MDLINHTLQTGPFLKNDGDYGPQRGGNYGEAMVSQFGGKYTEWTRRGYVFVGICAAAAAIPIATTLTNAPSLWNPSNSGKIVIPMRVNLSLGAVGVPPLQGFTISYLVNTGSLVAVGNPIATWTDIPPVNALLGKGGLSSTFFSGAVSTYTVNPARLMDLGFGHLLEGAAATGQQYSQFGYDFEGQIIMPPGTSIHLGSTIATNTTYWASIAFAEIPVPPGF